MEILSYLWRPGRLRAGWVMGPAAAAGMAVVLGHCLTAASPAQPFDEYQVKAAFLYNFAKFVQWPAEAFQTAAEPMAICVLGQDPFGRSLADTVAGRAIEGRSIVVRHIPDIKQAAGCHVLFIASTENKRSPLMLAEIKPGILTVGDSDASGTGAVINFKLDDGKVRFEINVEAAEREKLQISSRLLSLAHIVESGRK
jgi:YfiR/HmsC-like